MKNELQKINFVAGRILAKLPKGARLFFIPAHPIYNVEFFQAVFIKGAKAEVFDFDKNGCLRSVSEGSLKKLQNSALRAFSEEKLGKKRKTILARANSKIYSEVLRLANLKEKDSVLELGAGKGLLTEKISKLAGNITATDFVAGNVKLLEKIPKVVALNSSHEKILEKIPKNSKDKVVVVFATETINEPLKVFGNIKKILKKSGVLVLAENTPLYTHLEKLLNTSGFHVQKTKVLDYNIGKLEPGFAVLIKAVKI